MKRIVGALGALYLSLAIAPAAFAQIGYFGQNKVQYRNFKFQALKTDHFDIYYYPEEEQAARMAGRIAERWYTPLGAILSHALPWRQALVLYASGSQFRQTNVIEGELGAGTSGLSGGCK